VTGDGLSHQAAGSGGDLTSPCPVDPGQEVPVNVSGDWPLPRRTPGRYLQPRIALGPETQLDPDVLQRVLTGLHRLR
jgi:hypothetical protein